MAARKPSDTPMTAEPFLPRQRDLKSLKQAAEECQGCPLYKDATQTVFGAGPASAKILFIGEQPGDQEDLQGVPFVGPAGKLFDRALAEVGIERSAVYVTNAVKHFKWTPRGKRRLHAKPTYREAVACKPWVQAEILAVEPEKIVCLGATAAQALFGSSFKITARRGEVFASEFAPFTMATYHPSAVLRAKGLPNGEAMWTEFVDDLRQLVRD